MQKPSTRFPAGPARRRTGLAMAAGAVATFGVLLAHAQSAAMPQAAPDPGASGGGADLAAMTETLHRTVGGNSGDLPALRDAKDAGDAGVIGADPAALMAADPSVLFDAMDADLRAEGKGARRASPFVPRPKPQAGRRLGAAAESAAPSATIQAEDSALTGDATPPAPIPHF